MLSVLSADQEKFKMVNCRITFGNKWLLPRAKRRLSTLSLLLTCKLFSISFVYPKPFNSISFHPVPTNY